MVKTYRLLRILPRLKSIYYQWYNRLYFTLAGVKYGKRMRVTNKVYVIGPGSVTIGDCFTFTSDDCINPLCRNIRGALYTVSRHSSIVIGDDVGISSSCLWAKEKIVIGNHVKIGGDCLIMDNDVHPHDYLGRRTFSGYFSTQVKDAVRSEPVIIEDDAWIGARCIILKGVHIGARTIIAAGSVVTKSIPPDTVAGGNPCRVLMG